MTREQKLALILGFILVLGVGVLVSDHWSSARQAEIGKIDPPRDVGTGTLAQPGLGRKLEFVEPPVPVPPPVVINTGVSRPESTSPKTNRQANPGGTPNTPARDPFDRLAQELKNATDSLRQGETPPAAAQLDVVPTLELGGEETIDTSLVAVPSAPSGRTHTVSEGDTLWSIAARHYGSGSAHKEIARANASKLGEGGELRVGTTLILPTLDEAAPVSTAEKTAPRAEAPIETASAEPKKDAASKSDEPAKKKDRPGTYTVRPGDTLAAIAKKTLGTSSRWEDILDLNRGVIDDETSIPAGTLLRLPKS